MKEYLMGFLKQLALTITVIAALGLFGYLTSKNFEYEEIIEEQKIATRELKAETELALDYKYRLARCKRMHAETLRQLGLLGVDK
jgi:hypothetical protein